MRVWIPRLAAVSAVIFHAGSLFASCPATVWIDGVKTPIPNQIFCDDYDSYCTTGGPPGTVLCTSSSTGSTPKLQEVWYPLRSHGCNGTDMVLEAASGGVIANYFSGKYNNAWYMGQMAVRDWELSPPVNHPAGQVLDIHRFIQNVHGTPNNGVNGTNETPLMMTFMMAANLEKLYYSSGYMELSLGEHRKHLHRANTDYIYRSADCCGDVYKPALPVICAQGNPNGALPAGCPDINTYPPPLHQAIAIGAFAHLDIDPCDGCTNPPAAPQYRANNRHLTLFDGKLWWTLNNTTLPPGATVSGSLTDGAGNPISPPEGFFPWEPGNFKLVSTLSTTTPPYRTQNSQSYNTITLTIREATMKVEMVSRIVSYDYSTEYYVTSIMDNIPRQYTGAFDRIHNGVGAGCQLAYNDDWSTCTTVEPRGCLVTNYEISHVVFDKFLLHGGVGVELPGACCLADGTCAQMQETACTASDNNGNPIGHFTTVGQLCNESADCCPLVYGDMDLDNDVDMDDFAKLQTCLTVGGGTIGSGCRCLDADSSGEINGDDLLKFIQCAKGPGVPADTGASCRGPGW